MRRMILILFAFLVASGCVWREPSLNQAPHVSPTPMAVLPQSSPLAIGSIGSYTNTKYAYTFRYPPKWSVSTMAPDATEVFIGPSLSLGGVQDVVTYNSGCLPHDLPYGSVLLEHSQRRIDEQLASEDVYGIRTGYGNRIEFTSVHTNTRRGADLCIELNSGATSDLQMFEQLLHETTFP